MRIRLIRMESKRLYSDKHADARAQEETGRFFYWRAEVEKKYIVVLKEDVEKLLC